MENEILLTGGRITQGVVRIGETVRRPQRANAAFVHSVLVHLEKNNSGCAPRFHGVDEKNREILTFIRGEVPDNLGDFSTEQCRRAAQIIRSLHDALSSFPGLPDGMTVCHNDLSPCNFVFCDGMPCAVIDWDAASAGHPLDDLAYAAWMWLDIGNDENDPAAVHERMNAMLDAYGTSERRGFGQRMLAQMARVGSGIFPTEEQTLATRRWTQDCARWLGDFLKLYPDEF